MADLSFLPRATGEGTVLRPEGEAVSDPGADLVAQLIASLETQKPTPPPKVGFGRRIAGTLGDALQAYASVASGHGVPGLGPFAAGQRENQQRFQAQTAAADAEGRDTRNRIRVRDFQDRKAEASRIRERDTDERIRVRTQADTDAKAESRFQRTQALQQERVGLEGARLAIEQANLDDRQKRDALALVTAEDEKLKLEQGQLATFDLQENTSAALSNAAISTIQRLRDSGDPSLMLKAEEIDSMRVGLLRNTNLARDKATTPGVLGAMDEQQKRLMTEMDDGRKSLNTLQGSASEKPRKITDTVIKQVGARNASIQKIQIALKAATDLRNDLGKRGVLFNKPLPQWAQDAQLKDAASKILPVMAQLRSDLFGATLPAGEIEIAMQFIDSGITLDLDGLINRVENLLDRTIIEQQSVADVYKDVDEEASKRLFGSFESIKSGPIPAGLPPGSRFEKNTINGGKIYITPDGQRFTVRSGG